MLVLACTPCKLVVQPKKVKVKTKEDKGMKKKWKQIEKYKDSEEEMREYLKEVYINISTDMVQ
jgi:hypothetical protein